MYLVSAFYWRREKSFRNYFNRFMAAAIPMQHASCIHFLLLVSRVIIFVMSSMFRCKHQTTFPPLHLLNPIFGRTTVFLFQASLLSDSAFERRTEKSHSNAKSELNYQRIKKFNQLLNCDQNKRKLLQILWPQDFSGFFFFFATAAPLSITKKEGKVI
jgi:hypothetical protein